MNHLIEVENLRKVFKVHSRKPGFAGAVKSLFVRNHIEKEALKGVSLTVDEGEIVGLVGANGAGKTTLVKSLTGIIYPTSGKAKVLGHTPWERNNDFRRSIALIMGQKAQLWWDLPAEDCFLLLKEIYQIETPRYRKNLDYLVSSLGVGALMNIQIRRLSLGERMKMEIIAALLHNPRVLFLDEPTIGLDLTAQRVIRNFILEYRRIHKPAMIITSHYMEDIERLCERIVVIRQGDIVYDGSLAEIVQNYARHKTITVRISGNRQKSILIPDYLGRDVSDDSEVLRFQVGRNLVSDAAQWILQNFSVIDMNIEEEEIGGIIEAIMDSEVLRNPV